MSCPTNLLYKVASIEILSLSSKDSLQIEEVFCKKIYHQFFKYLILYSGKAKEFCDFAFLPWKMLVLGIKMLAITYLLNQNLKCILCGDIDITRFAENEHHGDRMQQYFIGQKHLMSSSAAAVLINTLATLTRPTGFLKL